MWKFPILEQKTDFIQAEITYLPYFIPLVFSIPPENTPEKQKFFDIFVGYEKGPVA